MPAPLQKREFILNQCREKARHRHQIRNQGESGKNEKVRREGEENGRCRQRRKRGRRKGDVDKESERKEKGNG